MAFPQTRITLVQRLAAGGSEDDWQVFFRDYWGQNTLKTLFE